MFNEEFWVAVALVLFIAFFGRKLWRFLSGGLDARGERIRSELDEAVRLREEAQNLLAGYQRRQRESEQEAARMLEHARAEAARIAVEADEQLAQRIERRRALARDKIAQAEARALEEIRAQAIDAAIAATATVIADGLDDSAANGLVDAAVARLDRQLASS